VPRAALRLPAAATLGRARRARIAQHPRTAPMEIAPAGPSISSEIIIDRLSLKPETR